MTPYLALTRVKEEKEKVGEAVPSGALSSGASLGETAFRFKLSQAQKPEAQPSEKQELGGARSQRIGGWAGSQPRAVLDKLPTASWGIWALPAPPASRQRAQGHRSQIVYSAPPGAQQLLLV